MSLDRPHPTKFVGSLLRVIEEKKSYGKNHINILTVIRNCPLSHAHVACTGTAVWYIVTSPCLDSLAPRWTIFCRLKVSHSTTHAQKAKSTILIFSHLFSNRFGPNFFSKPLPCALFMENHIYFALYIPFLFWQDAKIVHLRAKLDYNFVCAGMSFRWIADFLHDNQ